MKAKALFLSQYLKNVRTVGAVAPSSRYLAKKMLERVNFDDADVIVEYGPGTGIFTAEILAKKSKDTKLFVIEQNVAFNDVLLKKYAHHENVFFINDSVEHIEIILKKHDVRHVDYIVSGLPFAALPAHISQTILLSTVRLLGEDGKFITFQYTLLKKNFMHGFFKHIKVNREYRNIPPAYIFFCENSEQ
jgi:phospholipid N-methyltransferase